MLYILFILPWTIQSLSIDTYSLYKENVFK